MRSLLHQSFVNLIKQAHGSINTITSNEIKVEASFGNYKDYFYQCLNNSKWANEAQLIIAMSVHDAKLLENLRNLGEIHGVSIYSYNLTKQDLCQMPPANIINSLGLNDQEIFIDKYCNDITTIHQVSKPNILDVDSFIKLAKLNKDVYFMVKWLDLCSKDGFVYSFEAFKEKKMRDFNARYRNQPFSYFK